MNRTTGMLVLGAVAVIALSGASAYLGASLAGSGGAQRGGEPAPPARASDADLGRRMEEIDRQLGYLQEQMRVLGETSRTALDLARDLDARMKSRVGTGPADATGRSDAAIAPGNGAGTSANPAPTRTLTSEEIAAENLASMRDIHLQGSRRFLTHQMKLLSDTSRQGAEDRRAQALVEAGQVARRFRLDATKEDAVLRIYQEQLEQAHRDVGPLVRDGLERADVTVVRDRLRAIHKATDERIEPLLTEEQWKQYETEVANSRRLSEQSLEEAR